MKLTVKNFGPIKSAKVDVKPLTVFVGPSNTGKSYLAMLIYVIAKVMKAPHEERVRRLFHEHLGTVGMGPLNIFFDAESTKLTDELFLGYLKVIRKHWEIEAMHCFGEEWQNITERNGAPVSIVVSDDSGKVAVDFFSSEKDETLPFELMRDNIRNRLSDSENGRHRRHVRLFNLGNFILLEISKLLDYLPNISRLDIDHEPAGLHEHGGAGAHYLPAVRGSIMQSHRILVSTLIGNASSVGLTGTRIASFNGVISDFMQKLIMIDGGPSYLVDFSRRNRREGADNVSMLSKKIEDDIMRGEIEMKRQETGYPDFRYQFADNGKRRNISLIYASSSVSELAPIVLFIRYYLSIDDVFIVEEPEAHLHPESQREIASMLVELVNAGVNVVITTHSDVILEQVGNLVHADKVPKAKVFGKAARGRTLSQEKAGCYAFKSPARGGGTTVKPVAFDEQTGFLTDDHLDVSSKLYNETVELLNLKVSDENDRA